MAELRREFILDAGMVTDRESLHRYLKEQLELPEYYGNNLDALYDVLTEMGEETLIIVVNGRCFPEVLGNYGKSLIQVFREAEDENPHLAIEYR